MNPPTKLISAKHLESYSHRKAIVDAFTRWRGTLKDFAKEHSVAASTVKDLVAKATQGTDRLLDQRMNCGKKVTLPSSIAAWCFCYWIDHPKASLKDIWREVSKMGEAANLAPFSYKQVRLLFKRTPHDLRLIVASGARHAFEKAGLVGRKVEEVPNQLWQMDATELDLWCLDMATGLMFKPWMTCLIDGYSRVIMNARLHRSEPTTADGLIALSTAVLPKGSVDYPFFGLPLSICTDNHSTYRSADFMDALRRLNITQVPIPNACPSANGKIERWFHTFKYGLLARLDGYAGQYKGLDKAKKSAVPFSLIPKLVRRFILDYHLREHSSLGCTPWEKWHEALDHAHGLMVLPQEVYDAIKLRRDFKVARDGILIEQGRHYNDPCLAGLVNETITVLLSPKGYDEKIPAYYKFNLIGYLRCVEEDASLSEEIRTERLLRTIDIQRMTKALTGKIPNLDGRETHVTSDEVAQESTPNCSEETAFAELPRLGAIPTLIADSD